jgi:hypothetical protein
MSIWVHERIECATCRTMFPVRTVDGLNLTRSPDVRAEILAGTLNLFPCPSCGTKTVLERQLLYTDLDRLHFMLLRPRRQIAGWPNAERDIEDLYRFHIVGEPTKLLFTPDHLARFRVRAVFGLEHLREKLLVWDAGLDDRLFEVLKMQTFRLRPQFADQGYQSVVLDEIDPAAGTFRLVLSQARGMNAVSVDADLAAYHELAAIPDQVAAQFPDLFARAFVDFRRYVPVRAS